VAIKPFNPGLFYNTLKSTLLLLSLCFFGNAFAAIPDHVQRSIAQGNHLDAVQQLEIWTKEHSHDYESLFILGEEYANAGMLHKAIETFKHVSALRPSLADPHTNLASIYSVMGEYQMAINEMDLYIEKSSGSAISHENIAELHLRAARQHYKYALAITPNIRLKSKLHHLQETINPSAIASSSVNTVNQNLAQKPLINDPRSQPNTTAIVSTVSPPPKVSGNFTDRPSKNPKRGFINNASPKEKMAASMKEKARVSRYGPIVSGDTISGIAEHIGSSKPFSKSHLQLMVALFKKNKTEFSKNNINYIKVGKFLDIPTAEEVTRISYKQARSLIVEQQQNWQAIINKRNMKKNHVTHRISVR
jgi:FimV-like protein